VSSSTGPLQSAHQEIFGDLRQGWRRQLDRLHTSAPIGAIDRLITELEELLLIGRTRVPVSMEAPLRQLRTALPQPAPELRSRVKITRLMDQLYNVQAVLLRHRAGPVNIDEEPGSD